MHRKTKASSLFLAALTASLLPVQGQLLDSEEEAPDWKSYAALGQKALTRGEIDSAEELYNKALKAAEKANQQEPGVVNCLAGLAKVEDRKGNFSESDRLYELAMRNAEQATGNMNNHRYANYLSDLADLYHRHGKSDKAELALDKLLEIRTTKQPVSDRQVMEAHEHMARFLRSTNRSDEALVHESKASQLKFKIQNTTE